MFGQVMIILRGNIDQRSDQAPSEEKVVFEEVFCMKPSIWDNASTERMGSSEGNNAKSPK